MMNPPPPTVMNEKCVNYKIMEYEANDSYNKHIYWELSLQVVY
jgi:hypothetical protein